MPVTTVLSEDGAATIVNDGADNDGYFRHRFSWSAAFAGAFLATAVTFFLIALGAGFGLALTSPQHAATPTFLTLGAVYFFAAQAFGFAAGGHLAGRLIGPAPETAKEEEFRSAAHGLVVWALTVVATATLVALGSMAAGGSAIAVAAASSKNGAQGATMDSVYVGYWVDMLFRPGPSPSQAWLQGTQYAQANGVDATDASQQQQPSNPAATPSPDMSQTTPPAPASSSLPAMPPRTETAQPTLVSPASPSTGSTTPTRLAPQDTMIPVPVTGFTPPTSIAADKAEVSRILSVGMANGERLNQYDEERVAGLVAQDTGLSVPTAQRRVDNAETRIHANQMQVAETARKVASYTSLWIALSLLFGALVAAAAAMSARWEDDRITFGWPRREPE
jgi:hypothetical protein